jgi:hydroxymethylglutaryl-CoA reductase
MATFVHELWFAGDLISIVSDPVNQPNEERMIVVHLHVDVCESMGANTVNTIAEGFFQGMRCLSVHYAHSSFY